MLKRKRGREDPPIETVVRRSIGEVGNYGESAPAQLRLRQAQGILYEAMRSDYDPKQIDDASRLIRGVAIRLMHTASALRRVAEREERELETRLDDEDVTLDLGGD